MSRQDEGSNDEAAPVAMAMREDRGCDSKEHREADCESDADGPGAKRDPRSESEGEESDEEEPAVKRPVGGSDDEDERPGKAEEGGAWCAEGQGSSSDEEEGKTQAADSDSDKPAAASPDQRSNADADSETETPARPAEGHRDSEEEEPAGAAGLRWKAGVQSDSEEETKMRTISAGSHEGQQEEEEHRTASDGAQPGTSSTLVCRCLIQPFALC